MNIEESINYIKNDIEIDKDTRDWFDDVNNPTRKQIEESINAYETLLTAYEKEKEKNKDMSCDLTRADNIDESTMLKQIKLKLQEKNIPIETLLAEFERLEDIEDRKVQIEYNNVFNKGVKSVEDKIKAKVIEVKDRQVKDMFISATQAKLNTIIDLESLLEKE